MKHRLVVIASCALLGPALGACHVYYFAHARVPLSTPVDTVCMQSRLTDAGPHGPLTSLRLADGRVTSVAFSTPAMFHSRWEIINQVVRRDSSVHRGEVYRASSAELSATYVQINRRIDSTQGPLITADMARSLFELRDACGGRSHNEERLFSVEVMETPYHAWVVSRMDGSVRVRLTVDSREYRLHWARNPGRHVLRVDTLSDDSEPRHLRWVDVDTLVLPSPPKGTAVVTECWRDTLPADGTLVGLARETDTHYYVDILQAWALDRSTLKIGDVSAVGVECLNSGWGSFLPDAPSVLRAKALSFTPSAGMARIYAYLSFPRFPTEHALPKVIVDSQVVGLLEGGSFLMVEIEPGHHRVSSPGRSESALSFEAAPDSSYFIELRKKFWAWSWEAKVQRMDPVAAREALRRAHMVASSWPGMPIATDR